MAAVEKLTCFGERQHFSERTQFLEIFALELEFRFQPVRVDGMRFGQITSECKRICRESDVRQTLSNDSCTPHGSHTQSSELKPKATTSAVFLSHVFMRLGSGFARFC